MVPIRQSTPQEEGVLQASKWLKIQVLLDAEEMNDLLLSLGSFYCAKVGRPLHVEEMLLSKETFLHSYEAYVNTLKSHHTPDPAHFRSIFSSVWTEDLESLYALQIGEDRYLIKPNLPVIQLQ